MKHPKYSDKFHVERKFKERNEFLYDIFEKSNYYGNEKKLEENEAQQKEQAVEEALVKALEEALKEELEKEKAPEQETVLKKVCRRAFKKALENQKKIKKGLSKEKALEKPYEQEFIIEEALEEAYEEALEKAPEQETVLKKALSKALSKAKSQEVLQIRKFEYGTPEKLTDGLPEKINNVIDAHNALKTQIMTPICKRLNDGSHGEYSKYSGSGKPYSSLGSLTIYESGIPMKFVPTPPIV